MDVLRALELTVPLQMVKMAISRLRVFYCSRKELTLISVYLAQQFSSPLSPYPWFEVPFPDKSPVPNLSLPKGLSLFYLGFEWHVLGSPEMSHKKTHNPECVFQESLHTESLVHDPRGAQFSSCPHQKVETILASPDQAPCK